MGWIGGIRIFRKIQPCNIRQSLAAQEVIFISHPIWEAEDQLAVRWNELCSLDALPNQKTTSTRLQLICEHSLAQAHAMRGT